MIAYQQMSVNFSMHSPMSLMMVSCSRFRPDRQLSILLLKSCSKLQVLTSRRSKTYSSAVRICFSCFSNNSSSPSNSSISFSISPQRSSFSRYSSRSRSYRPQRRATIYCPALPHSNPALPRFSPNPAFTFSLQVLTMDSTCFSLANLWHCCSISPASCSNSKQFLSTLAQSAAALSLSLSNLHQTSMVRCSMVSALERTSLRWLAKGMWSVWCVLQKLLLLNSFKVRAIRRKYMDWKQQTHYTQPNTHQSNRVPYRYAQLKYELNQGLTRLMAFLSSVTPSLIIVHPLCLPYLLIPILFPLFYLLYELPFILHQIILDIQTQDISQSQILPPFPPIPLLPFLSRSGKREGRAAAGQWAMFFGIDNYS